MRSPNQQRPARVPTSVALAIVLLLLVVLGSALSGPWTVTDPAPAPATTAPVPEASPSPIPTAPLEELFDGEGGDGRGASTVIVTILGVLLLAALVAAARTIVRRRLLPWGRGEKLPDPAPGDAATSVVAVAPVAAIEEAAVVAAYRLRESADPTDDVVAAWVALERASEENGTARGPAQTPTEFTVSVLGTTAASPADVQTLLRLYHRARFTEHRITRAQGVEAAEALDGLVADLRSAAPSSAGVTPSRRSDATS